MRVVLIVLVLAASAHADMPYDAVGKVVLPGGGHGSCVLIYTSDDKALVVTNAHVIAFHAESTVVLARCKYAAKTVAYEPTVDLAFLVINKPPIKPVNLGPRDTHVVFTGYPHYDCCDLHWQYGNIVKEDLKRSTWRNGPVPGMSGGAVFDRKDGDLCGIVSWTDGKYGGGVADEPLLLYAAKYKDPESWVPDASYIEGVEEGDWEYAKQRRRVVTKEYKTTKAPHWKVYDE